MYSASFWCLQYVLNLLFIFIHRVSTAAMYKQVRYNIVYFGAIKVEITLSYVKFTHKFLMTLFLVTVWCCLPVCYSLSWIIGHVNECPTLLIKNVLGILGQ